MTTDMLGDAAVIVAILSFILPPIVSSLRACHARPEIVGGIVFAVVLIFAGVSLFLQDAILNPPAFASGRDLAKYYLLNALAVFTLAITFYRGFWRTIGATLTDRLESVGPQLGELRE